MTSTSSVHPSILLKSTHKIAYIDNLKILLIVIVVLHHSFITYGASGSWYYSEKTRFIPVEFILSVFTTTDMTFFMGLFFFLSSYFIEESLIKKGTKKFLLDRFKRLFIPLIFYSIVLSPSLNYMAEHYGRGEHNSFIEYLSGYRHWIDFGVLWFVAALLLFTLFFVLLRNKSIIKYYFPDDKTILFFAIALGLITYMVRGYFPVGWTLFPFNFQLAYFPQYIVFFSLGIIAHRNSWLKEVTFKRGKQWLAIGLVLAIIVLPLLYIAKMRANIRDESLAGNLSWQSLLFAEWEQITGVSLTIGLLGIGQQKLNHETNLSKTLARASYGVYIFHPLVLICLSLLIQKISIEPFFKLFIVAPLAVLLSFLLSCLLVRIPYVNKVV
jgi:peptidoglycan/LPS O-acetylase OafA/YrhL